MDKQNVELFSKHKVLSKTELHARMDILFETYAKSINIEALTMLNIAKRQILPAAAEFSGSLGAGVSSITSAGSACVSQKKMLDEVCGLTDSLYRSIESLEAAVDKAAAVKDVPKHAAAYHDIVRPAMQKVREAADNLEKIVEADIWPLPTYAEMLFIK
jgi:glutamine synthetase